MNISKLLLLELKVFLVLASTIIFLSGCRATTQGIGSTAELKGLESGSPQIAGQESATKAIEVLDLSIKDAIDIAKDVAESVFNDAKINMREDYGAISLINRNFWKGDIKMVIDPKIVRSLKDKNNYGITYDIKSEGWGGNFSAIPMYGPEDFLNGLAKYRSEHNIKTKIFNEYEILRDKGIVDNIPASIPTTYAGFKNYLDSENRKGPIEGIWATAEGKYTLGILHIPEDPIFPYKAFVIESRASNWKPGEIKIKFRRLPPKGLATGSFHLESKAEIGGTWRTDEEMIELVAPLIGPKMILVKQYPTTLIESDSRSLRGVGTGWAVSSDGIFVTNHHVIDGAKKIYVGFKGTSPSEARVLISDKRLDLAVIQMVNIKEPIEAIPIDTTPKPIGSRICVIGYPLAFKLGDEPRLSEGLINAQSGYQRDVTRYQISAIVNPGSSGGPVLDQYGNSIGVVVEKMSGAEGVNFAIKSGYITSLLEQIGIKYKLPKTQLLSLTDLASIYRYSILPVWTE